MENERRLWLWTNDHQPGLARGPDHRRDLVGRTGPLGAPGEKNSPEETMPTWLGVVKLDERYSVQRIHSQNVNQRVRSVHIALHQRHHLSNRFPRGPRRYSRFMEGWRENRKGSALSTSPDPAAMEDERCFRSRRILEHTMLVRRFLRDVRNVGTGIRYLFVISLQPFLVEIQYLTLFYFSRCMKIFELFKIKSNLFFFFISFTRISSYLCQ